jgi:hypothetical protein
VSCWAGFIQERGSQSFKIDKSPLLGDCENIHIFDRRTLASIGFVAQQDGQVRRKSKCIFSFSPPAQQAILVRLRSSWPQQGERKRETSSERAVAFCWIRRREWWAVVTCIRVVALPAQGCSSSSVVAGLASLSGRRRCQRAASSTYSSPRSHPVHSSFPPHPSPLSPSSSLSSFAFVVFFSTVAIPYIHSLCQLLFF